MYLYGQKLTTTAIKGNSVDQSSCKFQPADSRVSSMKNSSVSGWKRETISRQREKRGVTTSLMLFQ